ncbi:MAG TPA: carbon monoxide dehydrogenase subunit G [Bacillales bacterium]|nr:carbon monoxide dehydrogenase subunit G [Bacillales bacterium]
MQIHYQYDFQIARQTVWDYLQDDDVLERTLPGCKKFEEIGDGVYDAELGLNVGPVKGTFSGEVRLTDQQEPKSYRLLLKGKGKPGEVNANAQVYLVETAQGTALTCDADVEVTGVLASVGQRIMNGVAKMILGQFFKAVASEIKQSA